MLNINDRVIAKFGNARRKEPVTWHTGTVTAVDQKLDRARIEWDCGQLWIAESVAKPQFASVLDVRWIHINCKRYNHCGVR